MGGITQLVSFQNIFWPQKNKKKKTRAPNVLNLIGNDDSSIVAKEHVSKGERCGLLVLLRRRTHVANVEEQMVSIQVLSRQFHADTLVEGRIVAVIDDSRHVLGARFRHGPLKWNKTA